MSSTPLRPQAGSIQHDDVLATAVADGVLTEDQAAELRLRLSSAVPTSADGRRTGRLAELAGYAGGALVLGAAGLFLGTAWSDLQDGTRAAVLLSAAVALLLAGLAVARASGRPMRHLGGESDSARRRLVSALWALAAAATAGGAGVLADADVPLEAALGGLLVAAAGYALVRGAPGHVAAGGAAAFAVGTALGRIDPVAPEVPFALAYVCLGAVWAALTVLGVLRERDLGLALAALFAVVGAQLPVLGGDDAGVGYALTAAVAAAGYAGYLHLRSWPVLAAAVVATTLVVPEALHDWTDGSVSVAGALLVAGLTLLTASAAGLRLRQVPR